MKLRETCLVILLCFASFQICFGQDSTGFAEGENWLREYGIYTYSPTLTYRYDRYSKEDLEKFRARLDLLKDAKFSNEWEGIYYRGVGDEVGVSSLRLDSNAGFIDFYIYTCFPELRYINYGKLTDAPDSIELIPEFASDSPRKESSVKYVKIKWNDRRYLVAEPALAAFAEKAAGIYVDPETEPDGGYLKWANFWVKGDTEKELAGLPEFPPNYQRFQRFPIGSKIVALGKRMSDTEIGSNNSPLIQNFRDAAIYPVTLGAEQNQGVKIGMEFKVLETGETIYITKVYPDSAVGFLPRDTDENKNAVCRNKDFQEIPCPRLKIGFKVRTETDVF